MFFAGDDELDAWRTVERVDDAGAGLVGGVGVGGLKWCSPRLLVAGRFLLVRWTLLNGRSPASRRVSVACMAMS